MSATLERDKPFLSRFRLYLGERFPVLLHGVMTFVLCAGSIAAFMRGTFVPPDALLAFLAVFPLFFLMRVADEHKDHAEDMAFRPERPVPRGLVTLGELRLAALVAILVPVMLAALVSPASRLPLLAALIWIMAMSVEFGVSRWLKARPLVYLVSHMLVMPLLALVALSFAVPDTQALWTRGVLPILLLAFLAGATLEIGRKIWGTDRERDGVETYSVLWGTQISSVVFAVIAAATLATATVAAGGGWLIAGIAAAGALAVWVVAARYRAHPVATRAAPLQLSAGLAVILSYGLCLAGAWLG